MLFENLTQGGELAPPFIHGFIARVHAALGSSHSDQAEKDELSVALALHQQWNMTSKE